ncbi:MAG: inositol monophosphatase family protein [Geminicoccaceae bacterium]
MSAAGELEADRALLREAIGAAGALALRDFRADRRHWYKGPGQVVTETDLAVDRLLHEIVIGARPDDGWLSEERADDRSRLERLRVWIVDPIDGTRAFVDGVPEFSISVALAVAGRAVLGMVLNPATGELFEAQSGTGARLDGQPLQASVQRAAEGARLLSSRGELRKRAWSRLMPEAEFTAIGSLAYKLALVAAGRFDGLVSLRASHDWDLAAALLLIEEAGGRISEAHGAAIRLNKPDPRHEGLAAAGTASLHAALVARLAAF